MISYEFLVKRIKKMLQQNDLEGAIQSLDPIIQYFFHFKLYRYQYNAIKQLYYGNIIELDTGSGKTIVFLITALLKSFTGKNVHMFSFNLYLSRRDYDFASRILNFFHIQRYFIDDNPNSITSIVRELHTTNYIAFGTNSTFMSLYNAFLQSYLKSYIPFHTFFDCALIDEFDSLAIDQNSIPCILSSPTSRVIDASKLVVYQRIATIINEKYRMYVTFNSDRTSIILTDQLFNVLRTVLQHYAFELNVLRDKTIMQNRLKIESYHELNANNVTREDIIMFKNALEANMIFQLNRHYVVQNSNVYFLDKFTGRISFSVRFGNLMHDAILIKEGFFDRIRKSVVFQTIDRNIYSIFFQGYEFMCGASGTVVQATEEIKLIYNKNVLKIFSGTKRIKKRIIYHDSYVDKLINIHEISRRYYDTNPILIITKSIDESQKIYDLMKQNNYKIHLLNAEQTNENEIEKLLVLLIGFPNNIIVSTNFLSRGTDIKLGGDFQVIYQLFNKINQSSSNSVLFKDMILNIFKREWTGQKLENVRFNSIHNIQLTINRIRDRVNKSGGLIVIQTEPYEVESIDRQILGRCGRRDENGMFFLLNSCNDYIHTKTRPLRLFEKKLFYVQHAQKFIYDEMFFDRLKFHINSSKLEFFKNFLLQSDYPRFFSRILHTKSVCNDAKKIADAREQISKSYYDFSVYYEETISQDNILIGYDSTMHYILKDTYFFSGIQSFLCKLIKKIKKILK